MYIENLIETLRSLASREFQEVAWYENDLGAMTSFRDDVNDLFDDHNLTERLYEKEAIVISHEVHQALRDLDEAIDAVDHERSQDEIINDPLMEIVRQKAATILELIQASDGSESTVRFVKVGTPDTPITIEEAFKEASFVESIIAATKDSSKPD